MHYRKIKCGGTPLKKFIILLYLVCILTGATNDCESAVTFYRTLVEQEDVLPEQVLNELLSIVHRCKYQIPNDLFN